FTPHQDAALKAVGDWLKAKPGRGGTPPVFRLFGFAGTGKTTLARHIADGVDGEVKFAAFTGKAALVMRNKGCDGASTIHSLI
ncbi:AAA family ATPase, partial [Acinetobacter baumannii]